MALSKKVGQDGELLCFRSEINHKRLDLYISAQEMYPEDNALDIIFKSKEYRKKSHQMNRRHKEENVKVFEEPE
ncbi:DNA mismatch repair protein, MutS family [Bacillus sp. SG-1]|nr:DNA mismatch repair protein, MutS family [Bacillus sp. SG-1]